MSTQATFTQAGRMFPVAMACSTVAIIRAKPTPRTCSPIFFWALQHVGDDVRQRTIVADAAGEHVGNVVSECTSYMMPLRKIPFSTAARMPPVRRMVLMARR